MVRKVLLKKLFIFLLIIAFWTSLNIAPITANIEAGDAVGSGSSSIGYGDLVGPNLDDLGFPSPSGNRESAGVNTMLGVLVDDVEGPDVPSPPKHYKTLDIMLAEAGLGEEVKGPPPVPVSGTRELLVILAELSDATHDASHSVAYFDDRFFDTATPSVRDYFDEVSYGAFTYVPGEVRGWYLSTSTKAQYTANPYNVFAEAIQDVDPFFNFATYDTDSNGVVENEELTIFFIVSGDAGGAAHGRNYPNVATADGVSVEGEYSRTNEFRHMGSYCHELGHDLGLPDLYDVNGGSEGIGNYGLMGGGSWTFSHMTAWSKIQLGWITPTIVTANGYYDIDDAETTADAYILMDPDRTNEYFVIENRFPSNSYYETRPVGDPEAPSGPLPDEGIVIYHVDETKMQDWITSGINNVNDDEAHKGVDVECADFPTSHVVNADHLDQSVNRGDEFDLWSNDEYDFTDDSDPCSAIWYDGSDSGMAVRDLPPSAPTMRVFLSISNARKAGKIGIIQTHGDLLGSYAALADYYMSLGYSVEDITTQITLGKLQAYDMVVVGERGSAWLDSEIKAVREYICYGGNFVAIGDQLTSSVLDILGAYGISYTGVTGSTGESSNFDSLHPIMRDVSLIFVPGPVDSLQVTAPAYWIANDNVDTHTMIAGAEDGGRVLCLSDDFAWDTNLEESDNEIMFKNIADWMCARAHIGIIQTHGDLLGSYAALADYYMSLGYSVEDITTQITLGKLQAYDMVVVGERGSAWLPSEIAAVQDYIASGGGFVAIGDQLTSSVLDILGAYGISYTGVTGSTGESSNFDSLHPIMRDVSLIFVPGPVDSLQVTAPAYWIANDNVDTHTMIAGAEDGGRVLCLGDDFAWDTNLEESDNEIMFKNIADWMCARAHIGIIQTHSERLYDDYDSLRYCYRSWGYSAELITATLTPAILRNYDMLIAGEGGSAWLPSEIAAVQDYIASGGGFVAIGDQLTSSVLDILGAYGISYTGVGGSVGPSNNFDSLHPIMRDVLYINAPAPINSLQVAAPAYWIANDNGDTHIIIAGAEDGGRVLCLSDDFLSAYENTFFLNQNDVMFKNIADWVCTHQVCLYDDDSYDFSKQIRSEYSGGDFYYYATTLPGEFFANNVGQNGVQDLGDVGSVKLDEVAIPSTGYTRFGVEAIEGHTYVSLAQDGEEGMYIVFKVVKLKADYSCVKIEYLYRSTRSLEKAYLVVRGSNDNIYYLTYDVQAETWNTWTNAPGSTPNSPAATVINNELHLAVRGSSGDKIWHGYVNLDDNSFSGWTLLSTEDSGLTYDAPALTSNSTHACLVIRARNSCIFYRFYEVATRTWGDWIMVPAGTTSTTPAAVLAGDELHLAVRGSSSPLIWHGAVDLGTGGFSGWTQLDGTTPSPPVLTSNSTHLCLVIRGSNNAIYYRWYDLAAESWGGWTSFPFGLTPDVPAATITGDSLQIVVRGMVDDLIWHGTLDLTSDTWSGWSQLEGSTPSKPVLTS